MRKHISTPLISYIIEIAGNSVKQGCVQMIRIWVDQNYGPENSEVLC